MAKFSCVVIGNESLLVQCAEAALDRGNQIEAVVTHNADIRAWAEGRGLRVVETGKGLVERLQGVTFDWLLSIANLTIIPQAVLGMAQKGAVNFHDGPLPRHAGLNAPVWALMQGETQHGITWHMIEGGVDEGDILVSRSFDITPRDTALTLNTKAYAAAIDSFPAVLDQLENGLQRLPQDLTQRSYHGRDARPAGYGLLDFTRSATDLERMVRALDHGTYWNPLCVPKLRVDGSVLLVGGASVEDSAAAPGMAVEVAKDHLTVACAGGALRITGLTLPDGTPVDPSAHLHSGDVLALDADALAAADACAAVVEPHVTHWRKVLADFSPLTLPQMGTASGVTETIPLDIPRDALAVVADWAKGLGQGDGVLVADETTLGFGASGLSSGWQYQSLNSGLETDLSKATPPVDLAARSPDVTWPETPAVGISLCACETPLAPLTVVLGDAPALVHDTGAVSAAEARIYAARLELLAKGGKGLPEAEKKLVLQDVNATKLDHDRSLTMHRAFEAQVAKTPDATALVFEGQSLTYAALNARANRAAHLLREMGVKPGTVVGLCCRRSVDLMVDLKVALLVLKTAENLVAL